mmetsp:Transcript_15926/g.32307  ORF Transcript_15926/g.32307 Transcript_15926/m.32307 type:complete len:81 (-) Transcript_15926:652-894(-)
MSGAKKKLLVLGGTGFVGSEICRKALLRNCEVVALSRRGQHGPTRSTRGQGAPLTLFALELLCRRWTRWCIRLEFFWRAE